VDVRGRGANVDGEASGLLWPELGWNLLKQRRHEARRGCQRRKHLDVHGLGGVLDGAVPAASLAQELARHLLKQRRHEARRGCQRRKHLDVHGLGGHMDGEDSDRRRKGLDGDRLEQRRHEARRGNLWRKHLDIH